MILQNNIFTYMHFNPTIRSGISKFQDLMNAPRTSSFNSAGELPVVCTYMQNWHCKEKTGVK